MQEKTINHSLFGRVVIKINRRARHIIMRACPDAIYVTAPPAATTTDIDRALATYGEKLRERQIVTRESVITKEFTLTSPNFTLSLSEGKVKNLMLQKRANGKYQLILPNEAELVTTEMQERVKRGIIMALQHRAKEILPHRLEILAAKHGFKYSKIAVRNSHTRWGSCSNRGNINLSIFLMLLPDELIDYVLLHELCHTIELNHSPRFWKLLDGVCGCDSKALRTRLKSFKTDFM